MRADVKAKWVAALRSGDYKQGFGSLRKGDRHCCLGVLATLVDPAMTTWRPMLEFYGHDNSSMPVSNKYDDSSMPVSNKYPTREEYRNAMYGLIGDPMTLDTVRALGVMNDTERNDFNAIADYIEGSADL